MRVTRIIRVTYFTREFIVTRLLIVGLIFFIFCEKRSAIKYHVERQSVVRAKDVGRLIKLLLSVTKWLAKDVGRSIVLSDDINYFAKDVGRLIRGGAII